MMTVFDRKSCLLMMYLVTGASVMSARGIEARGLPPIPGVDANGRYAVLLGDRPVYVGSERSNGRIIATCFLETPGPVEVTVRLPGPAEEARISPRHRWEHGRNAGNVTRSGNELLLALGGPGHLMIRMPNVEPLLLVAMPPETDVPEPDDPDVIYFGPGVHDAGRLRVHSGQTVYLAPGSRVFGTIEGYEAADVRVMGRGVLDGSRYTSHADRIFGLVFERSRNIRVEGIRIRECLWWVTEFLLCDNVVIENVHVLSFYPINSGIMCDGCTALVARGCTLLTYDDCICPHALNAAGNGEPVSDNLLFENCLLFNLRTGSGNGIRIGASFETSEVRNWTFRNLTVVERNNAAIISDHSDWAVVRNVLIEDFYDETGKGYAIDWRIGKTRYSCTTDYKDDRGSYDGIYFVNVNTNGGKWRIGGADANHMARNINLYRCTAEGRPIDSADMIDTNAWVEPIRIHDRESDCRPKPLPPVPAPVEGRPLPCLIIDDGGEGFSSYGFEPREEVPAICGGTVHFAEVPDGFSNFRAAVYKPKLQGRYRVDVHQGDYPRAATNARWIVYHEDGYTTRYLSQIRDPGWHTLGTFELEGDSYVRLVLPGYFVKTNGPVAADAVRFTRETK